VVALQYGIGSLLSIASSRMLNDVSSDLLWSQDSPKTVILIASFAVDKL
jgi:hypothetical protein